MSQVWSEVSVNDGAGEQLYAFDTSNAAIGMTAISTPGDVVTKLRCTDTGILQTVGIPQHVGVALNEIPGVTFRRVYGTSNTMTNGVYALVSRHTTMKPYLVLTPSTLNITSSVGAAEVCTSVYIEGLTTAWAELAELVPLVSGAATTTGQFLRVNRVSVLSTSSTTGVANSGNLTIAQTDVGAAVLAYVPAGDGTANAASFTVPAGKLAAVTKAVTGSDDNTITNIRARYRLNPTTPVSTTPICTGIEMYGIISGGNFSAIDLTSPLIAPAGADIWLELQPTSSGAKGTAFFEFTLVDIT